MMEQWRLEMIAEAMYDKAIEEVKQWIASEEKLGDVDREEREELIENIINEFRIKMEDKRNRIT